jgi:hypothetical protein
MNNVFAHGVHECLCFIVGAWFHQQRVLIGLLPPHTLIYCIVLFCCFFRSCNFNF